MRSARVDHSRIGIAISWHVAMYWQSSSIQQEPEVAQRTATTVTGRNISRTVQDSLAPLELWGPVSARCRAHCENAWDLTWFNLHPKTVLQLSASHFDIYVLHATRYFEALTGTLILNLPPEAIPFGGVVCFANQCLKAWRLIKMYVENHVPQLQVVWWWLLLHRVVFCLCLGDRKRSLQRSMQTWVAPDFAPWVRLRLWRVEARVLVAVWNHVTAYHFAIVSFRLITLLLTKSFEEQSTKKMV